jgi:hypothetical protein
MRPPDRGPEIIAAVSAVAILILVAEVARSLPSLSPVPALSEPALAPSPLLKEVRHRFRHRRRSHADAQREAVDASPGAFTPQGQKRDPWKQSSIDPGHGNLSATGTKEEPPAAKIEAMAPPPPPENWTEAEVQSGRMDCDRRLSGLHVLFERLDPIKEGACGTPAPIRLEGFENGREPRLDLSPTPTISCKLAEALQRWFEDVVQPKSKKHLQASIVRVVDLSAYQCRSRYDDPGQRISQHAYANAIDISEFLTAKGERIAVLDHWNGSDERSAFLHEIHDGACEIFGTTLGPEANEAHKNHFHLDMKERRKPLCDFTPAQERARREEAARRTAGVTAKVPASEAGKDGLPSKAAAPVPVTASAPGNASLKSSGEEPQAPHKHRHRRRHSFHARF